MANKSKKRTGTRKRVLLRKQAQQKAARGGQAAGLGP